MHCRHCGSDCRQQPDVADMPAADFLRAIDSLTPHLDPHRTFIILTGGEALLRPDLEEVGWELYRRGYPWGVVTNAFLLDSQRLASLTESGMHSLTVSLDGLAPQHDSLRRCPSAFAHADRALGLLAQQHEVLWDVVTCVSPLNFDHLADLKQHLIGRGVRHWRLFSIAPMGRAASDRQLQLAPEQLRGLMDFIVSSRAAGDPIRLSYACEGFLGEYEGRVRDHLFFCRSGIEVASIRCDGSIGGCTSVRSPMSQGNIYTDDLWDVWQHRFQAMRHREWTRKGQCATCKVYRYCEGSGLHLYDDHQQLLTCHYQRLGLM